MNTKYAYFVYLLNTNSIDGYIQGAITLAYSLKLCTKYDVNCIIEKGIDHKYIHVLKRIFNNVFIDDSFVIKNNLLKDYMHDAPKKWKQSAMYDFWIEKVMFKFKCLKYTQYKKILMLDVDLLAVTNLTTNTCITDTIFDYDTPAGILSVKTKVENNTIIPTSDIFKSLNSFGIRGGIVLLEPSIDQYNKFVKYVESKKLVEWLQKNKHKINAGPDETIITLFYKDNWKKLDSKIMTMKYKDYKNGIFHHYNNFKPWLNVAEYKDFEDFIFWKKTYEDAINFMKNNKQLTDK
jgi:hypothetical protein